MQQNDFTLKTLADKSAHRPAWRSAFDDAIMRTAGALRKAYFGSGPVVGPLGFDDGIDEAERRGFIGRHEMVAVQRATRSSS